MENVSPAEKMYKNHLINVSNYQKRNPEKIQLKYQKRMMKLKANPDEYIIFKEKARISCLKHRLKLKAQNN